MQHVLIYGWVIVITVILGNAKHSYDLSVIKYIYNYQDISTPENLVSVYSTFWSNDSLINDPFSELDTLFLILL